MKFRFVFYFLLIFLFVRLIPLNAQIESQKLYTERSNFSTIDSLIRHGDYETAKGLLRSHKFSDHQKAKKLESIFLHCQLARINRRLSKLSLTKMHLDSAKVMIDELGLTDDLVLGDYHFVLGELLDRNGNAQESLKSHQFALKIRESVLGPDHVLVGESLQGIGDVYHWLLSDYLRAEAYHRKALRVFLLNHGEVSSFVARSYYNLAIAYRQQTDYENAELYALKSIEVYDKLPDTSERQIANSNNVLANIYFNRFDYHRARVHIKKTIDILSKNPSNSQRMIIPLGTLGSIYFGEGSLLKAEEVYKETVRLSRLHFGDSSISLSNSLLNLGLLESRKGNFDKAKQYLNQCLSIRRLKNNYGEKHFVVGETFRFLGELHEKFGYPLEALNYFHLAVIAQVKDFNSQNPLSTPEIENVPVSYSVLRTFRAKAKLIKSIAISRDSLKEEFQSSAMRHFDLSTELIRMNRLAFEQEESKLFLSKHNREVFDHAIESYLIGYKQSNAPYLKERIWSLMSDGKSQMLVEYLQRDLNENNSSRMNDIRREEVEINMNFESIRLALENKTLESHSDSTQVAELKAEMTRLLAQKDSLKQELEKSIPVKSKFESADLSALLEFSDNSDRAFLQYFEGDSTGNVYIMVVYNGQSQICYQRLEELDTTLKKFWLQLESPSLKLQDYINYSTLAYELYDKLIPSLIKDNLDRIREISIVADGKLERVPFAALLVSENSSKMLDYSRLDYLLSHCAINYSKSFTLNNLKNTEMTRPTVLAFSFTDNQTTSIAATRQSGLIPGAAKEINGIKEHFDGEFYFGTGSNLTVFDQKFSNHQILHFAAHGINDKDPAKSYLLLQNDSIKKGTESRLYAYQIPQYVLDDRLVVLSACATSIGTEKRGEGTYSLTRNFFMAGAASVISTLWEVDDQSSANLMMKFYDNFSQGQDVSMSLNNAKRSGISEAGPYLSHPFYWAGYTVTQHESAKIQKPNHQILIGAGILIMVLFVLNYRKLSTETNKD